MESLFELLSKEELDMILYSIKRYSDGKSELMNSIDLKKILRVWNDEKDFLYKLLGNKLIISKPVTFSKSKTILEEEIDELIDHPFIYNFKSAIDNYNIWSLVSLTSLTENIYPGQNFIVSHNGKSIKINQGCKTVRALGKIAKLFNIDGYEDFRLKHSLILNQKTVKGTLHLSIHPLDFITMSDNNCGWNSCMSWIDNGSYRRGTVEMMNSPCVLIAYISAKQPYIINHKQWNSKKWRELFIVTKDIISNVKGYPYFNDEFDSMIINWIRKLAKNNLNLDFENNQHEIQAGVPIKDFDEEFSVWYHTEAMYNDCYEQTVCFSNNFLKEEEENPSDLNIYYSGLSTCMICGEENDFTNESALSCEECSSIVYCDHCGEAIYNESDMVKINDNIYCQYCYEDNFSECPNCGEIVGNEEINHVYLAVKNKIYIDFDGYICDDCFKDFSNKIHYYKPRWFLYHYINIEDLTTQELINIFKLNKEDIHYYFSQNNEDIAYLTISKEEEKEGE